MKQVRMSVFVLLGFLLVAIGSLRSPAQDQPNSSDQAQVSHQGDASADEQAAETAGSASEDPSGADSRSQDRRALMILGVGVATVLGLIIVLKVNAFISLITAAIVVSLLAPGDIGSRISRVADAFGASCGGIGIVIAMAAVIGKCMLDSGAADRVVRAFLGVMGEKRSPVALMGSGYVLAIPVFFDTVFYLLVPLARSLHRRTGKQYLKYILAIAAGGAITHSMVPPTPGPLMMAANLGFDVGVMILVGAAVALPAAVAGLLFSGLADRLMPIPMRPIGTEPEPEPIEDSQLPSLFLSLLPVLLPVVMISTNTVLTTIADGERAAQLTAGDFKDFEAFRRKLREQDTAQGANPGKRIIEMLEASSSRKSNSARQDIVASTRQDSSVSDQQRDQIISALNTDVLGSKTFYDERAFLGVLLDQPAKSLLGKDKVRMKKVVVERMNRSLLESAYPTLLAKHVWETPKRRAANISSLFGNANLALLISTVIAIWVLVVQRGLTRIEMAKAVETSLMSGGVIILITAGGGAFGAMLKEAQIGDAIRNLFAIREGSDAGLMFLVLGFVIASVLKIAQGSGTVAMITGSAMLAGIAQPETLGYHPVYLATAIGAGSLAGSWMNDSGFWIFAKMGGLTEVETLKSWTIMLIVLGVSSFGVTLALAKLMPFPLGF